MRIPSLVAQIFNLLYRRFAIGRVLQMRACFSADGWQNAILRYSRLKICATTMKYPSQECRAATFAPRDAQPTVAPRPTASRSQDPFRRAQARSGTPAAAASAEPAEAPQHNRWDGLF